MVVKAVCVLKGDGDAKGTVHFEQEVSCASLNNFLGEEEKKKTFSLNYTPAF